MKVELPHVGESVTEGVIGKWLKQVGDSVEKYDPLVEVVTDKVNMEVPCAGHGDPDEHPRRGGSDRADGRGDRRDGRGRRRGRGFLGSAGSSQSTMRPLRKHQSPTSDGQAKANQGGHPAEGRGACGPYRLRRADFYGRGHVRFRRRPVLPGSAAAGGAARRRPVPGRGHRHQREGDS